MFVFPANGVIAAVDPARKTGLAVGRPNEIPKLTLLNFARELDEHADIFGRATRWAALFFADTRPDLFVIEAPVPSSQNWGSTNASTTEVLVGLHAIFLGHAAAAKVPVLIAPIRTWRKHFLGRGDLNRKDAKLAAVRLCRSLKWNAPDENAAEAGGIWSWGCGQIAQQKLQLIVGG